MEKCDEDWSQCAHWSLRYGPDRTPERLHLCGGDDQAAGFYEAPEEALISRHRVSGETRGRPSLAVWVGLEPYKLRSLVSSDLCTFAAETPSAAIA